MRRTVTGPRVRLGLATAVLALLLVLAGCAGGSAPAPATANREAGNQRANSYYRNGTRVVVRSATMEIRVENFEKQFRKARAIARSHGGFVTDYSIESQGDWKRATFTIRVPAGNFSGTRDALTELGTLESETVRARDFTNEYRDRKTKIQELRARERQLERKLADASSESERERIRTELEAVRDKIESLKAKQTDLKRRAILSTITVTMHEPVGRKPPANYRTSFGFGDSLMAGFYGGLKVLKAVVVMLGYLVSVGVSLLLIGLVGMVFLALAIAVQHRVWPRIRAVFGVARGGRVDVGPQSGATGSDEPAGPDQGSGGQ